MTVQLLLRHDEDKALRIPKILRSPPKFVKPISTLDSQLEMRIFAVFANLFAVSVCKRAEHDDVERLQVMGCMRW
jgi:hypothetical protein